MNWNVCRDLKCPQHNLSWTQYFSKNIKRKSSPFTETIIYGNILVILWNFFKCVSYMVSSKLKWAILPLFLDFEWGGEQ